MQCLVLLPALLLTTILPTAVTAAPPVPWEAGERLFPDGWLFTPDFAPNGRTAWLVHWERPLDLDAPQQLHALERRGSSWGDPRRLDVAPGRLLDWPTPGDREGTLLLSIATQRSLAGERVDDFDLWRVDLSGEDLRTERLGSPDLNREKTAANATRGVAANEFGAQLTASGDLWFWSQRPEGQGWRDIFFAKRARDGDGWQPPVGFEHNTPGRESHPWVSADGRRMIFTSDRAGGQGGDDLWFTRRDTDGSWARPVNLGPEVNSPYDDEAPRVLPGASTLFFTSNRPVPGRDDDRGYRVWTAGLPAVVAYREALTPRLDTRYDMDALDGTSQAFVDPRTKRPVTGIVEALHPDGSKRARVSVLEGRAHGLWIEWYPDGKVRYLAEWSHGQGRGTWYYFHETGEVSERVHVDADIYDGPVEGWTASGEKAFEGIVIDGERSTDFERRE